MSFYESLKSEQIGGITVNQDDFSYVTKMVSEGWISNLRLVVSSDRAMATLTTRLGERGSGGSIEVVVGGKATPSV